jgi:hypothetical protein
MVRAADGQLEHLALGDCTLAVMLGGSRIATVTDHRMDAIAADAFAAMIEVPIGSAHKQAARMNFVRQQLPLRNMPEGYPLAGSKPEAAYEALTGSFPLAGVGQWVIMSDGAARYIDFGIGTWPDALRLLDEAGPEQLLAQLRAAEAADPAGRRWPRAKLHDDATLTCSP